MGAIGSDRSAFPIRDLLAETVLDMRAPVARGRWLWMTELRTLHQETRPSRLGAVVSTESCISSRSPTFTSSAFAALAKLPWTLTIHVNELNAQSRLTRSGIWETTSFECTNTFRVDRVNALNEIARLPDGSL